MTTNILILIGSMLVLIAIGLPVSYTIICSSIIGLLVKGAGLEVLIQRLYSMNDSFPLLAIPYFFVAGELMLQGGISRRIVNLAQDLLGWIKGSCAAISLVACAFFGAISGSAFATTAAIGGIMYPEMEKEGYDPDFTAAIQAVGGTLGTLIPPSICCVVYSTLTSVSTGDMFKYILPIGLLAMFGYIACAFVMMKRNPKLFIPTSNKYDSTQKVDWKKLKTSFLDAIPAIMSPVIVLGGIYAGICTPTECANIAILYSLIIGLFVYKELNLKNIIHAFTTSIIGSACIMLIIDASAPFTWIMALLQIPNKVTALVTSNVNSPLVFMLIANVILLIAGMLMETNPILTIMMPLLMPVAKLFGINMIHFGIVTVLNLTVGCFTPPFGGCCFVSAGTTKRSVQSIFRYCWPFIATGVVLILLVTYLPFLWLY